jgi:hypothetical protein
VTYGVGGTWPSLLDGQGSLTLIDPAGNPDDPANWRASSQTNGSPGTYPDN